MNRTRNHYIDNAKVLLILMVVLGHALNPHIQDSRLFKALFDWIYTFHMPLFIFVSGMFSRKEPFRSCLRKNATNLLLPLLVFQFLYESLDLLARGELSSYTVNLQPYWILWYLWSLFLWKSVLNLLPSRLTTLVFSFIFALTYNCIIDSPVPFGINRTIGFFPIFLAGHLYGGEIINKSKQIDTRIVLSITTIVLLLIYRYNSFNSPILFHSETFLFLYHTPLSALFWQIFSYSLSSIMSFAILSLIPEKRSLFTEGGKYTLFIYLWHGFFIKALWVSGISTLVFSTFGPNGSAILFILLSVLITAVLSIPAVTLYSQKAIATIGKALRVL